MTHKTSMFLAALTAFAGVLSVGGVSLAYDGSNHDTEYRTAETKPVTETEGGSGGNWSAKMSDTQKQQVQEHKAKFQQRLETAKAERVEKLADRRLQVCEKRQQRINNIFDKATERNKKQLAVFQAIEQKVKDFYVNKGLTAEAYEQAAAHADAQEAAAVAAIETSETVSFDCATTDATKPGSVIKEAMLARHTALMDYRTAIKDLILVVKKHNGQNRGGDTTTGTDGEAGADSQTPTRNRGEEQ